MVAPKRGNPLSFLSRLRQWWRGHPTAATEPAAPPEPGRKRGSVDHVIILDGTLSSLVAGEETNAGLIYRLLTESGRRAHRTVYYEPGLQWEGWRRLPVLAQGKGINRQIRRAYGWLASHYRPGDRIWLFGYSRGAYAVRSLAGVIDRVGLVRHDAATERAVVQVYRHYQSGPASTAARAFAAAHCHAEAPIEAVCVFDTVKALGVRLPLLWMLTEPAHAFHSPHLGRSVRHGFQALALDETREAFDPVLWESRPDYSGNLEQVWFPGAHGDVGGHLGGFDAARPLSNIPLVWMLDRAEAAGLELPAGWRARFPCDASAPMVGTWRGFGALFLLRRDRRSMRDASESLHGSVIERAKAPYRAAGLTGLVLRLFNSRTGSGDAKGG